VINLVVAVFLVSCANGPLWRTLASALGSSASYTLLLMVGVALVLFFNALLSLLSFRWAHKSLLIVVIGLAAITHYYMGSYRVVINGQMITNVLETDVREASEQLSWALFRHMMLLGVLPAGLLVLTQIRYRPWRRELLVRSGVVGLSLVLLGILFVVNSKMLLFYRGHREVRLYVNPVYPIYSLIKSLGSNYRATRKKPLQSIALDARRSGARTAVVYVVGETARAEQFSLNGYPRETNPELRKRDVISFTDVESCGTDTGESLPGMFSHLGSRRYSPREAKKYENLLDVLQRTGVEVAWRDNNSGSKGIADRVKYKILSHEQDATLCPSGECYDEILLQNLDQLLRSNKADMLVVLHQKGSHGPSYYKRSPQDYKSFLPECDQEDVQNCDRQSIINAYDNTIVYTDHVLARLIDLLKAQEYATAMLYVSDHGESLGEKGIYLHGLPRAIAPRQQTHVPMIFWASPEFYEAKAIDPVLLATSRSHPYSHECLFHSLLGLFDVRTAIYQTNLDLFFVARQQRFSSNLNISPITGASRTHSETVPSISRKRRIGHSKTEPSDPSP
jgi:lipid A ethanolaminephosphotransferase